MTGEIRVGSRVLVGLAQHCGEPSTVAPGVVEHVFSPAGLAFVVKFSNLRTEVVSRYEIKQILEP